MRKSLGLALFLGFSLTGFALKLVSPAVLFPHEPLIIQTEAGEAPPEIKSLCEDILVPVSWQTLALLDGKTQWTVKLTDLLPSGPWKVATDRGECAFLLASPLWSIVEAFAQGEPMVRMTTALGREFVGRAPAAEPLVFLVQPASEEEEAWIGIEDSTGCPLAPPQRILLAPSSRVRLFLPPFFAHLTAKEVRPGGEVVLGLSAAPGFSAALVEFLVTPQRLVDMVLPPGWEKEYLQQSECCGETKGFFPLARIRVPPHAPLGEYQIEIMFKNPEHPEDGHRLKLTLRVVETFSPKEVIGHWDARENGVDWTRPYALTYERLLWAVSLLGREIPYTGTVMTEELVQELAREWANSATP